MELSLKSLGITKEQIFEAVVGKITEQFCGGAYDDEDNPVYRKMGAKIQQNIDKAVQEIADRVLAPRIKQIIEGTAFQPTNQWGEKRGEKMTFVEYLIHRAEKYMTEEVNYEGKEKGRDSYSWSASGTRIAFMIHKHLHHEIEHAMRAALATANTQIVEGIQATVKMKLEEIAKKLKVEVKS